MLDADIRLKLDRLSLRAAFAAGSGEVLALLGPNGSGKSTILRALAGLLPLAEGRVSLDGVVLEDPAARIRIGAQHRPVALMFQDYLLFPHLSAVENVAYGLRARGLDHRLARQKAMQALEQLDVTKVASARPGAMSGGQQQRVAMARALVTDPRLLLLDEPLAALDVSTKTDVRRHLRQVLRASAAANILVTHDLLDAVALADHMVVIEDGVIVQAGTPAEVTSWPRSRYVADLVGVNLFRGTARGTAIDLADGGALVTATDRTGSVLAVVPPASVVVTRQAPGDGDRSWPGDGVAGAGRGADGRGADGRGADGRGASGGGAGDGRPSGANVWPGQIGAVDLLGDRVRVKVDGTPPITAEVTPRAVDDLNLDSGGQLWVSVAAEAINVYS
jgi:molybdate transport system ATP-binding protein